METYCLRTSRYTHRVPQEWKCLQSLRRLNNEHMHFTTFLDKDNFVDKRRRENIPILIVAELPADWMARKIIKAVKLGENDNPILATI